MTELPRVPGKKGLLSAVRPIYFKMVHYAVMANLPKPPTVFGKPTLLSDITDMFGNNTTGDCYWAGSANETIGWNRLTGVNLSFTDVGVLSDYSAQTGYNSTDPSTDMGTDPEAGAAYRRTTGIIDASGIRHKIYAYTEITARNLDQVNMAAWMFDAAGIGVLYPDYADNQFAAGAPWDFLPGQPAPREGHYFPIRCRLPNGNYLARSWGHDQEVTPAFLTNYMEIGLAYISPEALNSKGVTANQFNMSQLQADLGQLNTVT